jgi:hypothetical protein
VSADSRKLFAGHHIEHPITSYPTANRDDTGAMLEDPSDLHRASGDTLGAQDRQRSVRIVLSDKDCESAFVSDIERIETEQFAGSAYDIRDRDEHFFYRDAKPGDRSDLIQRGRQASTSQVAQAMNFDIGFEKSLNGRPERSRIAAYWAFKL